MTYLVLARKWRPRSFDTLVGQDHVVRALTHALDTQRLHHAWLFTGTRGVGKTTLSRILAKSLNCEKGITAQPCGQCRACTEIDAGRYVDYVELDAASNRGVDEMTQLLEQAVYAPSSARFKVYMIDEVHMLTGHAFNAMLKTLEEPPPHVKFILATTDPQKIPVTVLSRCLQFNLKHMTVDAIVAHLQAVLADEGLAFDVPALRLLGQAAGGSMRDALSLTDQAIAYSAGNLTLDAVQGMLGTIDQRHLVRLLQALAVGQAAGVLAVADELAGRGLSYAGALADLAVLLSHIAIQQRVPGVLPPDDPLAPDVQALAGALHPDLVQLYYSVAVHSRSELSLAPDEYAGFVMACLRMLALTPESEHLPEPPTSEHTGKSAGHVQSPGNPTVPDAPPAPGAVTPGAAQSQPASVASPVREPSADVMPPAAPQDGPKPPPLKAAAAVPAQPRDASEVPAWESLPDETAAWEQEAPAAPEVIVQPQGMSQADAPVTEPPATVPPATDTAVAGDSVTGDYAAPDSVTDTAIAGDSPAAGDEVSTEPGSRPASAPDPSANDGAPQYAAAEFDVPDYADGDWEPVMDDAGADDGFETVGIDVAKLAPLPKPEAASAPKAPRLARMTAPEWPALAETLPLTGLADELARQSEWLGVEGDCITLRVAIHSLAAQQGQARLRTVLTEHFGKVVQLKIVFGATGSGTARAVEQVRWAERQKEAESAVANDAFVRSLIEDFGARVMPGSITALDNERAA